MVKPPQGRKQGGLQRKQCMGRGLNDKQLLARAGEKELENVYPEEHSLDTKGLTRTQGT